MKIFKKKKRSFFLLPPVFLVGAFLVYYFLFRPTPPLEEKFVIEKAPALIESPVPTGDPAPGPGLKIVEPKNQTLLAGTKIAYQTFNNCGPANLSMILSFYGISKTQKELGEQLRPYQHPVGDNDDKTVSPQEFVKAVEGFGLKALYRPNGSIDLLKLFLSNNIPLLSTITDKK